MKIVGVVSDLMFSTRLGDAARRLGHDCTLVRRPEDLETHLGGADLVVVDLNVTTGDGLDAVRTACAAGRPVIAYGEHVQADRLEEARQIGAEAVMSRGEFTQRLPELLA